MIRAHIGIALACLVVATGTVVSGCAHDTSAQAPSAMTGMPLDADYSGAGQQPGALAEANSLPTIDRRLRAASSLAARIEYTSTSGITDGRTQVTGTVFVPKGDAPEGGWPIVAYGHATTGIESECAPSLSPTLLGTSNVVTALVNAGFVVTVPDYQGLGTDNADDGSYHPYLDSTTAGYNVIDSVKAARRLVPAASERWVAIGVSQGGQATWAANELAETYGAGLTLLGTVSVAPAADITGFADAAADGQLTSEQMPALVVILETLKRAYPDFPLDDYRRGFAKDHWDKLIACDGPAAAERATLTPQLTGEDLRPGTPQAVDTLRTHLQHMSLPHRPTTAPMLVIFGGNDALVPPAWTDRALRAACGMGDVIDIQLQPDKGHAGIDVSSAFGWVNARFRGEPAADSCLSLAPPGAPQ
ncbi:alpha/beta fold hydrolase [Mycolicibacterium holsaticum]|uniref:Lipase n=1 Tax=Mycolicibacterium holsaticum TaxID=152142 RepID=A0A1E3RAN4_9MYCO|nr:alpha/beta fold hydrolase [Mycolicibacterium holsaticum]ODQ86879.1 lipase [Mycolicibacterium holsaticum]